MLDFRLFAVKSMKFSLTRFQNSRYTYNMLNKNGNQDIEMTHTYNTSKLNEMQITVDLSLTL